MTMHRKTQLFLILIFLLGTDSALWADSPITSTDFYHVYLDHAIVETAASRGVLDYEMARYIGDPRNPIDVKIAIVNALSWGLDGKSNALRLTEFLRKKYGWAGAGNPVLSDLTWSEATVLGYMAVLDNYFEPARALKIIEHSRRLKADSFSVALVEALVRAQVEMDGSWCKVWRVYERVLADEFLVMDFRPEGLEKVHDYMVLYKDNCS